MNAKNSEENQQQQQVRGMYTLHSFNIPYIKEKYTYGCKSDKK